MANDTIAQRPKRRYYPPELKGQIVAECQVSGASVAGVALAHGINANIVHRWMREQADSLLPAPQNEFVALNLPPPVEQVPATETSSPPLARAIQVEVRRSAGVVTVNWPLEDAASCAAWLCAYFGECDRSFRRIVTGGLSDVLSAVSVT